LDLNKKEIYDTWKPGTGSEVNEVWDITFGNGNVYAATEAGVYSADFNSQGLSYFGNWHLLDLLPSPYGKYTSIIYSGTRLYVNLSNPISGGDQV
jgi:hypothetical protein